MLSCVDYELVLPLLNSMRVPDKTGWSSAVLKRPEVHKLWSIKVTAIHSQLIPSIGEVFGLKFPRLGDLLCAHKSDIDCRQSIQ